MTFNYLGANITSDRKGASKAVIISGYLRGNNNLEKQVHELKEQDRNIENVMIYAIETKAESSPNAKRK